jgi:sRNA-binding protein
MRNLLAFGAALVLTFAIAGWWLDWYRFRTAPSPDGKPSLTIDFNPAKMLEDARAAEAALEKQLKERAARLEAERKAAEQKKAEVQ